MIASIAIAAAPLLIVAWVVRLVRRQACENRAGKEMRDRAFRSDRALRHPAVRHRAEQGYLDWLEGELGYLAPMARHLAAMDEQEQP